MKLHVLLVSILFSLSSAFCVAETAVIVHPSNSASLSQKDIANLFLGKKKSFPGGGQAIPVNQEEGSAVREGFNDSVLGKSSSQLKSYWSRLIFTGKGTPPKEVGGDADVVGLVAANPNTIGYVDAGAVSGDVKVVFSF